MAFTVISPLPQGDGDDSDYSYELFSVIIHKGGCYGGHYHVYIKDVDKLGRWEPPVSKRDEPKESTPSFNSKVFTYQNMIEMIWSLPGLR